MPATTRTTPPPLGGSFSLRDALICTLILTFCSPSVAAGGPGGEPLAEDHHDTRLNPRMQPLLDLMNGPAIPLLSHVDQVFAAHSPAQGELRKRQEDEEGGDDESTTTPDPSSVTATPTVEITEAPPESSLGTSVTLAPMPTDGVLQPFDTSLRTDQMTAEGCPDFFDSFLNNDEFLNCIPISSLMKTSSSFFEVTKSLIRLSRTLDDACGTSRADCSGILSKLADDIVKEENCEADVNAETPLVMSALNGFLAYDPVRDATCLKSPDTGNYCFADAITNSTSPEDSSVYYLPLGTALPGGSRPTCNQCLQATMQLFANASKDDEQPMATLYNPAAEQVNMGCGPSYAPTVTSSAASRLCLPVFRGRGAGLRLIVQYALPLLVGHSLFSAV